MLKVALYEGVELPDRDEYSLHIQCGPYRMNSKLAKCENSRAVWNEYLPDLVIRGSTNEDDIYDVIMYLATSENHSDRICFKRIKAKTILEANK
mmetsp:Transcript_16057/g.15467  ORF Transcript_16057/g.15467 Transcript_16057/m.15467 type:complete len:94 (+) Transcript_16057:375-656(+)